MTKTIKYIAVTIIWLAVLVGLYESYTPWLAERHYRDGFQEFARNNWDVAIAELQQACDYAPWESQYRVQLAKSYESKANAVNDVKQKLHLFHQSEREYMIMLEINPDNPWYLNGLAQLDLIFFNVEQDVSKRKKLLDDAENLYKKAATIDKTNPLFQTSLGYFYHRLGKLDLAKQQYQKAYANDPFFVEGYFNEAMIEAQAGNVTREIELYEKMNEQGKLDNYSEGWTARGNFRNYRTRLGNYYFQINNLDKAIENYEFAISTNPADKITWRNLAAAYHKKGDLEKAIDAYNRAIQLNPDFYEARKLLGYAYWANKKVYAAINELRVYQRKFPEDQKVNQDLFRMERMAESMPK